MLKRAWLSITRKKSKTVILAIIMFVIANLVLATIFIKNATDEGVKFAKNSLGSEVYLQADMEKLRAAAEASNSETSNTESTTQEHQMIRIERPNISMGTVKTIGGITYVKDYSYSISSGATAVDFDPIESTVQNSFGDRRGMPEALTNIGDIQIEGVNSYAYISGVKDKTLSLTEGTYFDEKTDDSVIISYELATLNGFKVGDTIKLKNNSTSTEISVKVIGIYNVSTNEDNERSFINSGNKIYMNVATAAKFLSTEDYNNGNYSVNNVVYYLSNPENSDKFISKAKELVPTLESSNLKLDINSTAYETMVGPIESVGSFATTILFIVIGAAIIIISLIINNQIKDRKYEMGVLMSLGETKKKIVAQVFVELLIVSTFAFIISTGTSLFVADKMAGSMLDNQLKMASEQSNNNFGRPNGMFGGGMGRENINSKSVDTIDELTIVTNASDYTILFLIGYAIIFTSMIVPSLNIIKYEPKTILTRRD